MKSIEITLNERIKISPWGVFFVKEANRFNHRCTGCYGLENIAVCRHVKCMAEVRKDGKNIIVLPYELNPKWT